jgi:sensor histidine kinase YesM
MFIASLKRRYDAFTERVFASLTEIERRDVRAFDQWFYHRHGWLWIVWIALGATAAAAAASQLPWNMSFLEAALLFNLIVFLLVWTGLSTWFGYRRYRGKLTRFMLTTIALAILGAIGGGSIADIVHGRAPFTWLFDQAKLRHAVVALMVFSFLYAALVALIANLRNREYAALTLHLEAEARQSELSRQLAESQLKLLQLQIEPHFLFNTLGSAQQLAEKGAPEAARLIAELIRFLRAASPALRDDATTLKEEASMIGAYLAIMRTRLGSRLAYRIDVPPALEEVAIPPGILITLVENAIKHGIEPAPRGGEISVIARRRERAGGDAIEVTVADTGAGLSSAVPGQGIGLANVRERLALHYGDHASVELGENEPRGFIARLCFPGDRLTLHAAMTLETTTASTSL